MDVASLVRSITSCFDDAAALVRRIREREEFDALAIDELIDSLELGPLVINGYFNSDSKRFGDSYSSGDSHAREQLKDVLIHLQMTVLTTLSTVLMLDKEPEFATIQAASDDCRVNAGVSLGQLSQRLADPAHAQQYSSRFTSFPFTLPMPLLKRSQSMSSHSSEGPRTPTTPELEGAMADLDYPGRLPGFIPSPGSQDKAFAVLQGLPSPHRKSIANSSLSGEGMWDRRNTSVEIPRSHPPSVLSEQAVISPVSPELTYDQWSRQRPTSSHRPSTSSASFEDRQSESPRERYGPDDYNDMRSTSYQIRPVKSRPSPIEVPHNRYRHLSNSTQTSSNEIYNDMVVPRRPSVSRRSITGPAVTTSVLASRSSISVNAPIPVSSEVPPLPTPPLPSKSPARRVGELELVRAGARKILGDIDPYIDRFVNIPDMPTENNMKGYCKGAFRLQIGLEKKAFGVAQRPAGMMGLVPYWKCEKCHFEGPVKAISQSGKKQSVKIFDPSVREFDGIRFKWAFLAKCHVPMKVSSNNPDGSSGSFGCIFCTAEGKDRQWNIANMSSVGKGKNAQRPAAHDATPIFGNSSSFMEHLQFHRQMNYWPNREMQRKLKCIVGRAAERGEDYDINFLPLEVEMEA